MAESSDLDSITIKKAKVRCSDMVDRDMQEFAVDCAIEGIGMYSIEKDIAAFVKLEFDKKYDPAWHCIVGRNYGSYVTHEASTFIFFYLGKTAVLLFKSGC